MIRTDLPPLPDRMRNLPVDHRGYPVPWFVDWINGKPDFRVVRRDGPGIAHREHRCWLCGRKLGNYYAFVIGPMCAINRVSAEPPSHNSCAKFAATACPFLTRPMAKRNERGLENARETGGVMIARNPGVALVWTTDSYEMISTDQGGVHGVVFQIGPPERVAWYAEGRAATRAEVMASIESGLPILQDMAREEGPDAMWELLVMFAQAMKLVPA